MSILSDRIAEFKADFSSKVPDEIKDIMATATQNLIDSGIEAKALKTTDSILPFALPNAQGVVIDSRDFIGSKPMVITFYRGGWCPYCNLQLKAYQESLQEIRELGADLIAITPEDPDHALETTGKNEVQFDILSDNGNEVAKTFGLVFSLAEELRPIYAQFGIDVPAHNGDDKYELPMAATYIVDTNGQIVWDFVQADYTGRADVEDILETLRSLQ